MSDVPGQGGGRPFLSARHVCSRPEGAHIGELSLTYAARLHRPYLDLGPLADGPLHSQSIHFAFAQLVHRVAPAMPLQNHPSPALRNAVVDEARLMHYRIARAAELSPRLRTNSWNLVVEHVERFPALGDDAQVRLIHLLEALGLYADIEEVCDVALLVRCSPLRARSRRSSSGHLRQHAARTLRCSQGSPRNQRRSRRAPGSGGFPHRAGSAHAPAAPRRGGAMASGRIRPTAAT